MQIDKVAKITGIDDEIKLLKIKYGLEIIKNESIKMAILLVLFLCLGLFSEFVFATLILLPVRLFSGGLHMNSNTSCFGFTLLFYVLGVIILPMINIDMILSLLLLTISSTIIICLSPIASQKRPISTMKRYSFLKKASIAMVVIEYVVLLLLLLILPYNYFNIGVWIFCLQSLQLAASKLIIIRKERKSG